MSILIRGIEMPPQGEFKHIRIYDNGEVTVQVDTGEDVYEAVIAHAVQVPPHGRCVDADALVKDLKRQCEEVFKIDAVSPDDFWIKRDKAYNERLWKTWCESFFEYLKARETIIEAEGEET